MYKPINNEATRNVHGDYTNLMNGNIPGAVVPSQWPTHRDIETPTLVGGGKGKSPLLLPVAFPLSRSSSTSDDNRPGNVDDCGVRGEGRGLRWIKAKEPDRGWEGRKKRTATALDRDKGKGSNGLQGVWRGWKSGGRDGRGQGCRRRQPRRQPPRLHHYVQYDVCNCSSFSLEILFQLLFFLSLFIVPLTYNHSTINSITITSMVIRSSSRFTLIRDAKTLE